MTIIFTMEIPTSKDDFHIETEFWLFVVIKFMHIYIYMYIFNVALSFGVIYRLKNERMKEDLWRVNRMCLHQTTNPFFEAHAFKMCL